MLSLPRRPIARLGGAACPLTLPRVLRRTAHSDSGATARDKGCCQGPLQPILCILTELESQAQDETTSPLGLWKAVDVSPKVATVVRV
jgi:hypothetical protein